MTDALLAVGLVLVLAGAAESLRAVLDGRLAGAPASITVLAPVAEAARALRRRGRVGAARGRFAGAALVIAAGAQLAVVAGAPVWWLGVTAVLPWVAVGARRRATGRAVVAVLLIELVLAAAVAAPVLGSGSTTAAGIAAGQVPAWYAVTMPVAFLAFVVASAAPWGPLQVADDGGSALVPAGRALLLASAVALAVPLFLGGGSWGVLAGKAAVLMIAIVLVGRRFPRLGARTLPLRALALAAVLALLQVGLVEVLARLASPAG